MTQADTASTSVLDPRQAEALLSSLDQPIEPVRVSLLYRFGLLLVAVAMILLPLLYLSFIAGIAWLVYLHAVHDASILTWGGNARAQLLKVVIYAAPIIAGGVAILFMLKPMLARPPKPPEGVELNEDQQPLLFQFVRRLTAAVGAPMPRCIRIDCEVNASAGFRRGLWSLLGSDLVLTIGAPLAAGLELRQLAGVLAHEFGHFTQGGAMRLTYVIRSLNAWFARVVYERDRWDDRLDSAARSTDHWAAAIVFGVTRGSVWFSRRVLWVLMNIGHGISCFMLRQMEYDADRYEARVAGSQTFASTALRLAELSVGSRSAFQQLQETWAEGRLGSDLPALIAHQTGRLPSETVTRLHQLVLEEKTGFFATHPADSDRIASAVREQAPGVITVDHAASGLFNDFPALASTVTLHHYQQVIGLDIESHQLASTADLVAEEATQRESFTALEEMFGGGVAALRPVPLPGDTTTPPDDPSTDLARQRETRSAMVENHTDCTRAVEQLDEQTARLFTADRAGTLLDAGYRIKPADFNLMAADAESVEHACNEALSAMAGANEVLDRQLELSSARIGLGLRFLHAPLMSSRIEASADWQKEVPGLLAVLPKLCSARDLALDLRRDLTRLTALFHALDDNQGDEGTIATILVVGQGTVERITALKLLLEGVPYPFRHATGDIDLGAALVPEVPGASNVGEAAGVAEDVTDTLSSLYFRVLGRLAFMVLEVERTAG